MREQFEKWLVGNEAALTIFDKDYCYTFMRLRKRAHLDVIYERSARREQDTKISAKFEYAGVFNREDGIFYDIQYDIKDFYEGAEDKLGKSKGDILTDTEKRIREIVNATIADNRDNLRIKSIDEVTETRLLENLDSHLHCGAAETARWMIVNGETPEDVTLSCTYSENDISDADFLDAITDLEAYGQRAAAQYIEDTQENMFIEFLANDATKTEMQKLIDDPEHEAHIVAAIKRVLEKNTYKMVNVTTEIGGKVLTFKTEASDLNRDPISGYNEYCITAADRASFKVTYCGRNYYPKDIVKITYGKAVIYEKGAEANP